MKDDVSRETTTPPGVTVCSLLFAALGAYLLTTALLVRVEAVSFTAGAWLLGGVETMGPGIYLPSGTLAIAIGYGLFRCHAWARHVATVAAGVVFVLAIPTISGAVAYSQVSAIAREGVKIIVCVMLFRYLNTGDGAEAFRSR